MSFDRKEYMKEYNKQYREKNRGKIKEQRKQSYIKNKEKVKEKQKIYREKNKEKKKQYNKSDKGIKVSRISNWKKGGIKSVDFDIVYEKYINTHYCEVCNIKLTIGRDNINSTRCLDHHHSSGEIRNIVCKV